MRSLIFIFLVALIGCSKSASTVDTPVVETVIDTVGRVWLDTYKFVNGWDTAGNYIAGYNFSRSRGYSTLAQYNASISSGIYKIRYVGTEPLFHPDSVTARGGQLIAWKIATALKGQPIFETYNIATGALYKRYIASKDSVEIIANFSYSDNYATPNRKIGEAFLYYLNVKQNDNIWYRKN